jgi:hypothetical protein
MAVPSGLERLIAKGGTGFPCRNLEPSREFLPEGLPPFRVCRGNPNRCKAPPSAFGRSKARNKTARTKPVSFPVTSPSVGQFARSWPSGFQRSYKFDRNPRGIFLGKRAEEFESRLCLPRRSVKRAGAQARSRCGTDAVGARYGTADPQGEWAEVANWFVGGFRVIFLAAAWTRMNSVRRDRLNAPLAGTIPVRPALTHVEARGQANSGPPPPESAILDSGGPCSAVRAIWRQTPGV